ncbi:MAG TPA: M4 family metallopeptidase, partial [Labilithrix sp.]|nr:M4 family metallopeptidase [Labilithrix sp.]
KLAFVTLAGLVAAACSSSGESQGETPTMTASNGVAPAQLHAFRNLESSTNQVWKWVQHDEFKTPMHLSSSRKGNPVLAKGTDVAKTTVAVLAENKALFKMRDPEVELRAVRSDVDELGMSHARFQQLTHGIPVDGAELMAHYDKFGHLASIDANYVANLDAIDVNPAFDAADALSMVKGDIASRSPVDEASLETVESKLVVRAPTENAAEARLAYKYKIRALAANEPAIWVVTVDAKTGDILHRYNNLQTVQGQGDGVLGDRKTFEVIASGNTFVMTDATSVQIRTLTAQQEQVLGAPVTSDDPNSWDTGVPGAGAAVDAHFNAAAVFRYYRERHARNAIDGAGGAMVSTVHFGRSYENAAWDGRGMIYGDGGSFFRALSVGLDVVGHEFTHGVTTQTSNLEYLGQSGALNEAVSDIFAAFIEHSLAPDEVKNWTVGESVVKSGAPLRDMRNPNESEVPQPAHMNEFVRTQQDNGGVHTNSGIINNAAYLMTVGGTNPVSKVEVKFGIGWEKSERLWYRANTKYFLEKTDFRQAAQGLLQAAEDIGLTMSETKIIDCALKATGILQGSCADLVAPRSGDLVDGEDVDTTTDNDDESDAPPRTPTRRRRIVVTESGCSAAPGQRSDVGVVAMVAAALALIAKRRKKG